MLETCCGKITTAVVPFGQTGAVVYGPNVNAAAILLNSAGTMPVERTAMLMAALLASPVSTGFVARAQHYCRAHRFFSTARWCPKRVGLVLAELIVEYLLLPGVPITLAVDDTLFVCPET
jgi:DDE superfamily endonuclease